jgi:GDP-L-fucose synthase
MPTNLYGPNDNYDLTTSHVLPALIRKAHEAKVGKQPAMTLWGTGSPRREFMHVDDCADALVYLLRNYSDEGHVNVGSGSDIPIAEAAQMICDVVGYSGGLEFDTSKPDGTPQKLMDDTRLRKLGWAPSISLRDGLAATYQSFLNETGSGAEI